MEEIDLFELYRNYIFSIEERKEYGDQYGDTEEILSIYEKKLEKVLKKENREKC